MKRLLLITIVALVGCVDPNTKNKKVENPKYVISWSEGRNTEWERCYSYTIDSLGCINFVSNHKRPFIVCGTFVIEETR